MSASLPQAEHHRDTRESVVVRFAGDSGDGMQTAGAQFGIEAALSGHDISTFPDFPAEIRAPAGTTYGVSAFQVHFGSHDVKTAGDDLDVLVALNPAALKVNLTDLGLDDHRAQARQKDERLILPHDVADPELPVLAALIPFLDDGHARDRGANNGRRQLLLRLFQQRSGALQLLSGLA